MNDLMAESGAEPGAEAGALGEPAAPAFADVPRELTGDPRVDALVERLADVTHLDTDGHLEVYEDVHGGLRETLSALDAHPGPPVPSPASHTYDNRS